MMILRPKTRLPLPQAITALALVVGTLVPQRGIAQEGVELQFVSFPKAGNPAPLELRLGDEKTIQVEMPTNRISETYSVDAMPQWTLGETVEDEEGEPVFRALANVRSLGTDKQLILVIRRANNNQGGLRMIAIPNGESELGGGSSP